MYGDKTAIIGAGFCGLGAAAALKRHGFDFDVIEADDAIGGNWYHGVYETAHIISSRNTTQYSDFPMPKTYPDFPSAAQMLCYLNSYADHYNLRSQIQLNTHVERVEPAAGERWAVTLANGERRVYGAVVIANGHHWDCRYPSYTGNFDGELIHSKHYKGPDVLQKQRVLVIGGGNSACDIAVEAARFGASSHISMRRGYWFLPKTMLGKPLVELVPIAWPLWTQRLLLQAALRVIVGPYEDYGLQRPDHQIFDHHPTINTELLHYIRHQRIIPHPDIARYSGRTVEFVDGTQEEFDLIVAATGYNYSIPMLAPGIIEYKNGIPQVIGGMFAPEHKNIYFFGLGQARYGAGPLISAGAEALVTMMQAQAKMRYPVGGLLRKLGIKSPKTMLVGPHESLASAKAAIRIAPRLVLLDKLLGRAG